MHTPDASEGRHKAIFIRFAEVGGGELGEQPRAVVLRECAHHQVLADGGQ